MQADHFCMVLCVCECVCRIPVSGIIEGFSFRYLIREAVHYLSDGWVTWPCCCQPWHLFVWTITDVFVIDNWVCALEQTYEGLIAVVCVHVLDCVCFRTHFTVLIHPAALCLLSRWTHYYDFSTAVRCLLYFCVKKRQLSINRNGTFVLFVCKAKRVQIRGRGWWRIAI